jgi:hypothetical protein
MLPDRLQQLMKNSTIPIVFHAGTYGTYLEWVLSTLIDPTTKIINPVTDISNSHHFKGHHLFDINGWRRYLASNKTYQLVRFHPKTSSTESISDNFLEIEKSIEQFVYTYPDDSTLLLCLSNQFDKVWKNWWEYQFKSFEINPNKIYANWPVKQSTDISQVPRWIQREFLSFYVMPMWLDQIEWKSQAQFTHSKCLKISVYDLLFKFDSTIEQLVRQLKLTTTRPVSDLLPIHNNMLSLQKNINIDQLCKNIVHAIMHHQSISWPPMSIVGESWIQWQLRNLGYEIKCHGLDTFPTNSVNLQELLYKV